MHASGPTGDQAIATESQMRSRATILAARVTRLAASTPRIRLTPYTPQPTRERNVACRQLQPRCERGTCELAAVCKFRYSPVTYCNLNPASLTYVATVELWAMRRSPATRNAF
jgi:hypothetical protein